MIHPLAGIYAAAVTPLKADFSPDLEAIPSLLDFLAGRGCHGALILGTTGEGPSFSPDERAGIFRAALEVRRVHPGFRLLAGTGTPSLTETVDLTRTAFDLGYDGVVVLPPYYYRTVSETGLLAYFSELIRQALPADGSLFIYHIPSLTGIPLSPAFLKRLKEGFPRQVSGFHPVRLAISLERQQVAHVENADHLVQAVFVDRQLGGRGIDRHADNL